MGVARSVSVSVGNRSEDGLAKAVEIVLTPAIFAAVGFGLDRWLGTGPWLALSFGMVSFVLKLLVEWYRYAERMSKIESDFAAQRPTARRGIDRSTSIDEPASLPTGVSLETAPSAADGGPAPDLTDPPAREERAASA